MKKRIVCVLLTLIMLVSLVPATALTASAASLKTSEAAITIMKKLAIFKKNCYQVPGTNEFRIGYGTICSEKHKTTYKNGKVENSPDAGKHSITQAQADQALRKLILDLDAKVNSFASSNSLTLSQCQHDALVLFTFDVGDSWMSGSGVVRSAIVSKASTNDLLKAMSDWASDQDDFRRRKIEVNMYKNGIYSDVTPSSFGTVTYNPDAGTIPQNGTGAYSVLFDTTKTSAHIPSPTRSGYKFMGWYSAQYDGTLVPSLTGSYNGRTLWAGWQATSVTANNANDLSYVHGINETLKVSQLVSLDVYSIPTKKNVKPFRTINKDTATVTAIKDFIDDDGNRWCKLSAAGDGWVLLKTSGQSSGNTEYTGGKINVTVTVTNAYVNRRANDSASSALTGSYKAGTKLKIVATNAAKTWGQVEENGVAVGWVALMYTDWSTVYDGSAPSDANNTTPIATATVTYNGYLNARSDPGVDNKIVGGFAKDTTVNVFEIRTVNGHRWGRPSTGWICLTYTNVKMLTDKNVSDTGVLDYAFEVTLVNAGSDLPTYAQPTTNSNNSDTIKAGTTGLKITNAAVADGLIWVKAHWTVKETDKDGKTKVIAKSGWATYNNFNLVPTKFTVVSDSLNIREAAGSDNEFVFKLTKGTARFWAVSTAAPRWPFWVRRTAGT